MIKFCNSEFSKRSAELVVLERRGKTTWGLYIKGLANENHGQKPPEFTLCGLPFPQEGIKALYGKPISLPNGESEVQDQPQALVYVWDWSAVNDNAIILNELSPGRISVSWSGSCDDPEFYDARSERGQFEIHCICDVRHET